MHFDSLFGFCVDPSAENAAGWKHLCMWTTPSITASSRSLSNGAVEIACHIILDYAARMKGTLI